jgi:S-(hydroxymethyl)mycothiol dehydrogenase
MTLEDGTELSPALGIGAFAEKTLVAAGQCTKVDEDADPAAVGLLGCGVMAGIGAAINTGEVKRGESVAVIGCGGVGIAAVAGAKLAGATTIIAVDIDENKIAMARSLGATHGVNSRTSDPVEAIRALTGGNGADVVIEAVGRPETYKQAFYARDLAGRVVLVGVPTPDMQLELPLLDVFGRGGSLKSSWYGDCLPSRDFPMLVSHYKQGNLDLDAFVSERITIDQVEEAFDKMHEGKVLRSVVEIRPAGSATAAAATPAGGVRMSVTIENLVTSGTFSLDGGTWDVDNNVWIVGNDTECVIIDSPHDAAAIINAVRGRKVLAILLTHAHNDHIGAARDVAQAVDAPIWLNPEDQVLWEQVYPGTTADRDITDGDEFQVAGATLQAIHTPGHSPGSTCFHLETENTVFTGDTLFNGGPGATGRSYSDYPTILASIRERLLTLPAETTVRTGHGDNTTIAAERETLAKVAQ